MIEASTQAVNSLTLVLAIAAAWTLGHYSGAVVGPAFGSRAITMYSGIAMAGVLVVLGHSLPPGWIYSPAIGFATAYILSLIILYL